MREWMAALRRYRFGSYEERSAGLLATLAASFANYVAARSGKPNRPPLSIRDYAPWIPAPKGVAGGQKSRAQMRRGL